MTGKVNAGCWLLETGCWILDDRYWILDTGYWILDTGYWILDAGLNSLIGLIEFMVNRTQVKVLIDRVVFFQSEIRNPKSQIEKLAAGP